MPKDRVRNPLWCMHARSIEQDDSKRDTISTNVSFSDLIYAYWDLRAGLNKKGRCYVSRRVSLL
jgi:hypothetical protein